MSYAGQIHYEIEDFVRGQIRQKIQITDGQHDPIKLKAMVKHWSQQMSAAVNHNNNTCLVILLLYFYISKTLAKKLNNNSLRIIIIINFNAYFNI